MNHNDAALKKAGKVVMKTILLAEGVILFTYSFDLLLKNVLINENIPDAKAAVDKEWDKFKNLPA